ncbi:AraC family transcriptional regulator [Yoonia sediminilitoris]|uniref:AraC family transcriptional regulator n=1 Tax=Yoonia sediminilitoris TaxID=1286148 RepID=A0A2T6KLZ6_9RHOB|nr:AraC family transcriptional regulator [Yoonia sediminilitoris]PUB17240.1 AraC family transcriptional regulator [Yoonia sediminilitoris]RCW97535.1 AraC family transcriptional regulator [Yoonia sediminilitoris]
MSFEKLQHLSARLAALDIENSCRVLPSARIFQRIEVSAFEAVIYNPVICLILQGKKEMKVGERFISLGKGDALLVSHDLPVTSRITMASPAEPYRALIVSLNLGILRQLYEQVGEAVSDDHRAQSLSASVPDPAWIGPIVRYLELMDAPLDARVLGPMILKEIHFRLLMSPIGGMLRNLLSVDSHASRIAKSIQKIRAKFREPLVVGELAQVAGMSQSSFHEHFKSVTGTTPLQYQKDLRMIEARALLARGVPSVSAVGFEVGYESSTHFSRDYSRKFGCSPKKHLAHAQ